MLACVCFADYRFVYVTTIPVYIIFCCSQHEDVAYGAALTCIGVTVLVFVSPFALTQHVGSAV